MGRFEKLRSLRGAERLVVFEALVAILRTKMRLRFSHPRDALHWAEAEARRRYSGLAGGRRPDRETVLWAVRSVGRRVPGVTCLTTAIASRVLLGRYGYEGRMRIGVGRDDRGEFRAHAWIEVDGEPMRGSGATSDYTKLPGLRLLSEQDGGPG